MAGERRGIVVEVAGAAAVVVVVYFLLPLRGTTGVVLAAALLIGQLALLLPLAVRRSRRILTSDRPVVEAAAALLTLVTAVVVGFASVYYVLAQQPGEISGLDTKVDALYYTASILGTVGFGDITADGQLARGVVTVHMLFNLVLVATAVRLVGKALSRRVEG
jgi:hypothetical protein